MINRSKLKGLLAERGVSQWQLAIHLGVKPSSLSDYVRGARPPPYELASQIERALSVAPGTLTLNEEQER
jgi:DNA-binding transcriptional regulator YdaS (Cro superfamily)